MTLDAASTEVERRIEIIEAAIKATPPRRLAMLDHDLEVELEDCRLELNALLYRAEAIATQLRKKYQMLAGNVNRSVADGDPSGLDIPAALPAAHHLGYGAAQL